ncbi:MAG: metallophosphoesterase [Bacillota bacterium]|nr:metallophosphoesterase [Bacillota bacterium]
MIYFTSDLHLGHKNIIKLCDRPFISLEEMDETLIANWNQVVTNGDTIYIVGDLMFRTQTHPADVLKRLKGKKHLILGNHDRSWLNKVEAADFFKSVEHYTEISDGKRKLALCHYPMMSWGGTGKGSYLIHGHIHNNRDAAYWPLLASMDHALNASVEINHYQPGTFDQLVENNELFKRQV